MTIHEWKPGVPATPGYFERRIRWFKIELPAIRVVRWRGHLVWNLKSEKDHFQYVNVFGWREKLFMEYRRFNGVLKL